MKGEERRKNLITLLSDKTPVAAGVLAERFGVSRQVIVQDVALLRSGGSEIISTPKGYLLASEAGNVAQGRAVRIFKVRHTDDRTEEELNLILSVGGCIKDVFVRHRVYGTIRAEQNVDTPVAAAEYMRSVTSGKSSPLKNVTDGYHYHTVTAEREELLDKVEQLLRENGFLIEK